MIYALEMSLFESYIHFIVKIIYGKGLLPPLKNLITSNKFLAPRLVKNTRKYNMEKIDELNLEYLTTLTDEG